MKFSITFLATLLGLAAAAPTPHSGHYQPEIDHLLPTKREAEAAHDHHFHVMYNGKEVGEMQVDVDKRHLENVEQHVHLMMDGSDMGTEKREAEAEPHGIHHYVHFEDMDESE